MSSGVRVTRSQGRLADIPLTGRDLMEEVGLSARERIIRRTRSGQDVDGARFRPYSEGYAKAKQQALGTTSVDLQVSGGMLNDIEIVELTDTRVVLGYTK